MPHTTKLYIVQAHCWRCRQPAALAMIKSPNTFYGPEGFSAQQTHLATQQGAVILPQYSRYAQTTYPANSCGHCKAFLGEHYLFTEYFMNALDGHYPYQTVVVDAAESVGK